MLWLVIKNSPGWSKDLDLKLRFRGLLRHQFTSMALGYQGNGRGEKKTFLTRVVFDWFTIQWRSSNCMLVLFFGFTLFFQRVFMCTVMSNIFLSIENRIHRMCDQRWNRNQIHVAYLIIFFLILDANYINRRSIIGFVSIQRRFTWNYVIFFYFKDTLFLINPKTPPKKSKKPKI